MVNTGILNLFDISKVTLEVTRNTANSNLITLFWF